MLGYIFAVISSIFFSLYVVPRKLSKSSPVIFSFFMALGFSASSIIMYLFYPIIKFNETLSPALLWSIIAGIIWASAFVLFVISIDSLGLSRSNQWKNLQGPVAVFLSLLILSEFAATNPFFTILAAAAIFISAVFFTSTSENKKQGDLRGIYLAVLSSLGFGSVAVIQKYVTTNAGVYTQQVVWSLSIAASLLLYIVFTKKFNTVFKSSKKDILLGLIAGVLYFGASLFQLYSYNYLEASISFTIIQMSALWTIAIGIFIFKEINLKRYYKKVGLGLFFTLIGIIFLVFAKR